MDEAETYSGDALDRLQAEICTLESDKVTLLLKLASIDSSLSHLKARYGTVKNRTALIATLPSEILAKIFELGRDLNTPGGEYFEVVVSQVTSVWREVATNTPPLWNMLEIAPFRSSQTFAMYVARAKASSTSASPSSPLNGTTYTGMQSRSPVQFYTRGMGSRPIRLGCNPSHCRPVALSCNMYWPK